MQLNFTKMQGVGNDYLYVDARNLKIAHPERLAVTLSDRHFGVGSDGLVLMQKSQIADIKMTMFNADGSEGLMCGNAVRCIAKYCLDQQIVTGKIVRIETKSGVKTVRHLYQNLFSVQMGVPQVLTATPRREQVLRLSLGNPHAVYFPQGDLAAIDLARWGQHTDVNIEFAKVVAPNTLQVRVWERGSGATLGCGTGACAVAVASVLLGLCDRKQLIKVQLPGGELLVDYRHDTVILLGTAETVFTGTVTLAEDTCA